MRLITALFAVSLVGVATAKVQFRPMVYDHEGTKMEGFAAWDSSRRGPRPTVLVVHDWNGIDDHERGVANKLASQGYFAFCIDVYGQGVRPVTVKDCAAQAGKYYGNVNLFHERLSAGLSFALTHPRANANKVVAIGYCFGGTAVLEMARHNMPVLGVASFHGGLSALSPSDEAIVPRILVMHGEADTLVNDEVPEFRQEMKDRQARYTFRGYPGAKHSFTVKASSKLNLEGVGYSPEADRQSWRDLTSFLQAMFK